MQDGNCPDESVIRAYLDGELSPAQRFEVENHLASCESCRDFAEGLAMLSVDQITRHEIEVKAYIHQKLSSNQSKGVFHSYKKTAIAASILLVLSVGTLLWFLTMQPSQSKLAYKEAPQQPIEASKNELPANVEKPYMDLAQDSAEISTETEKMTAPEEVFVSPAPVSDEIIVIELADQEEELPSMAGIEAIPLHEIREEITLETIPSTTRSTLAKTQTLPTIPKKDIQKVQGQVVEASTGAPLPGTIVTIKGTTTFALTDADGHFEIPVKDKAGILEFSFLGFDNETIHITDTAPFKIEMKENLMAMDEVVVVGYGVQRAQRKREHNIALPDSTGNEVYDTVNLTAYHLQLGDKEKALRLFDRLRELMKEAPLPESILNAERLTQEDRLKRASKMIQNWLVENNP